MKTTIKHCELISNRATIKPIKRKTLKLLTTTDEVDNKGRHVTTSKFVTFDPYNELRKYRVDDFSIQTLQSVGADLHLTNLTLDNHTATSQIKEAIMNINNNPNNN